jgi:hypothetical protein
VRIIGLAAFTLLVGCVDLSTVCPSKPTTQGLFGEIVDDNNVLEENVEVDLYLISNGTQGALVTSHETTRGGFQFAVNPATYQLCSGGVCTNVVVPTGVVEQSGVDTGGVVTWDAPAAVPPEVTIGPCTWGSGD